MSRYLVRWTDEDAPTHASGFLFAFDVDGTVTTHRDRAALFPTTKAAIEAALAMHVRDVAIFRVLDDGREERLLSYEEALTELGRLRAVETVVIAACETFERFESGGERPSRGELGDMVSAMRAALGGQSVQSADPLAALEAAERRLLEAGGWTPGDRGFWVDPCDGTQWPRAGAVDFERKRPSRLAAKGGA